MDPLLSVIIPARNAESFIIESIESIRCAASCSFEILVVDHASTDNTREVVENLNRRSKDLRVLSAPEGGGPGRAKNVGVSHACGEFITFLDADDVRVDGSLDLQLEMLEESQASAAFGRIAGLCDEESQWTYDPFFFAWVARADSANRARGHVTAAEVAAGELPGYFTLVYRKSLLDQVGEFDETLTMAEDFDFAYRCALHAPLLFVDEPCVIYRIHGHNTSVFVDEHGSVLPKPETTLAHQRALRKHGL